jgi:hypothetical protein
MHHAIVQNKSRFTSETHFEEFLGDTEQLAGLPSEEQFLAALELFKAKWLRKEKILMQSWFVPYWCSEVKRNWFVSFTSPGLTNTNNSLECKNKYTKKFVTKKERFAIKSLIPKMKKELLFLSLLCPRTEFQLTPTSSRKVFVHAQLWILSMKIAGMKDKCILKGRSGNIYVPSSALLQICPTQKELMVQLKSFNSASLPAPGENFAAYVSRVSSFYVLNEITPNGIIHFSCTCYKYHQYASCKHSLGCSIFFNKTAVPSEWIAEKLSDRSRAGRPKKAPKNCLEL